EKGRSMPGQMTSGSSQTTASASRGSQASGIGHDDLEPADGLHTAPVENAAHVELTGRRAGELVDEHLAEQVRDGPAIEVDVDVHAHDVAGLLVAELQIALPVLLLFEAGVAEAVQRGGRRL